MPLHTGPSTFVAALVVDQDEARSTALACRLTAVVNRLRASGQLDCSLSVQITSHLHSDGGAAHLLRGGFEFAFVDLDVQGSDGIAALQAVAAHRGNYGTSIAVMARNASANLIRRCYAAGADGFIPDGLSDTEIDQALAAFIVNRFWMPAALLSEESCN